MNISRSWITAEFYLETVRHIFQEYTLPLGKLKWRGTIVEPRAIRRTMLLTVEGERDDICAVGQTVAAHDLCSKLRPYLKRHHMQAGVGHYGVFSGKRWETPRPVSHRLLKPLHADYAPLPFALDDRRA
jgi:poly(3-hydroxybutyrate) depolymerase